MSWEKALHKRLEKHLGAVPQIHSTAYVAPTAYVDGDVTLGPDSSVWPYCVLRGDIEAITLGEGSNIQDGTIVHLADDLGAHIGKYVTIGHRAIIHACTIEDECLVGMGATILDGAHIGTRSIIGAGALVTKGTHIPPGSLVMGIPGKVVRPLSESEQADVRHWAEKYVLVARAHAAKATKGPSTP